MPQISNKVGFVTIHMYLIVRGTCHSALLVEMHSSKYHGDKNGATYRDTREGE